MKKKRTRVPRAPRRQTPEEARAKFEKQMAEHGIKPMEDFDQWMEDAKGIWPEDENIDDFIAWYRRGRQTGYY